MIIEKGVDKYSYYVVNNTGKQVILQTGDEIRLLSPTTRKPFILDGCEFAVVDNSYVLPNNDKTIEKFRRVVSLSHYPVIISNIFTGERCSTVHTVGKGKVEITSYSTGDVRVWQYEVDTLSDEQISLLVNGNFNIRPFETNDPIIGSYSITVKITKLLSRKNKVRGKITYGNIKLPFETNDVPDKEHILKRVQSAFSIMTPDGKKTIPLKYSSLDINKITVPFIVENKSFIKKGNVLLRRHVVDLGDRIVHYYGPQSWKIQKENEVVVRFGKKYTKKSPVR